MPLSPGSVAPDFELVGTHGKPFRLSRDAAQEWVVIYFYPRDFSPLCTAQSCSFRDDFAHLKEFDCQVYGISEGSPDQQAKYRDSLGLPFHLLSDRRHEVMRAYGTLVPLINATRRVTYLLKPTGTGHEVAAVFEANFQGKAHVEAMLAALRQQKRG